MKSLVRGMGMKSLVRGMGMKSPSFSIEEIKNKNLSGAEGRKSQGALARLCEFSMPEATIEIPV